MLFVRRIPLIGTLIALVVLAADQLSKTWALDRLREAGASLALPGPIDFTLVFNRSNAFGMVPVAGDVTRWGLAVLNIAVAGVLLWLLWRRPQAALTAYGFGFVIAGALGNAIDRLRFGAVIDFIDASEIGFRWVFNVADASLDVGIGLLVLGVLVGGRQPAKAAT